MDCAGILKSAFSFTKSHSVWRAIRNGHQPLRGGQCVERQRTAIKPLNANFIFTVGKCINIYYILTIYNTFCRDMNLRVGSGCRIKRDITRVQMERNIRRATESKGPSLRRGDSLIAPPDTVSRLGDRSRWLTAAGIPGLKQTGSTSVGGVLRWEG